MNGFWIKSQDGTTLTYCKTLKVWESGRIVNHLGKEYVHIGEYGSKERAKEVLEQAMKYILSSNENNVFQMPLN